MVVKRKGNSICIENKHMAGVITKLELKVDEERENKAQSFSFEMSDDEIESWSRNNNARHREIRSLRQENLGIEIHGYVLERTKKNERFYDEAREEIQSLIDKGVLDRDHSENSDICFFFEEETESFQCTGGMNSLIDDLIVFHGVEAGDIEKRTTRFMAYVTSLRKLRLK